MSDAKIEQYFDLTKFLHEPKTKYEIEENFNMSESTFTHMFTDKNAFNFMDVEFPFYKTKEKGRGGRYINSSFDKRISERIDDEYRSTVHPVILPLNLTEVYALTNHLLDITKGTEDYQIYKEIADKIYPQLSNYAKRRLGRNVHDLSEEKPVKFISEEDMFSKYKITPLLYAIKANNKVEITYIDGTKFIGKIKRGLNNEYICFDPNNPENEITINKEIDNIAIITPVKSGK